MAVNPLEAVCGDDKTKCPKMRKVRLRMLDVGLHEGDFGGIFKDGLIKGIGIYLMRVTCPIHLG